MTKGSELLCSRPLLSLVYDFMSRWALPLDPHVSVVEGIVHLHGRTSSVQCAPSSVPCLVSCLQSDHTCSRQEGKIMAVSSWISCHFSAHIRWARN